MTITVALLRHASTRWNEQARMQGRRDVPLSAQGRRDASTWRMPAGSSTAAPWVSSPLQRAVETARLASGGEPQRESALIEMDWGEWEGLTLAEIRARFGADMTRLESLGLDFRPPGGESPRDVQARVLRWLTSSAATRCDAMVAVTHKGVLRAVLAAATGWDMMGKPPVRLRDHALHRFAIDKGGGVSIDACNIAMRDDSPI